jgi:hypothetical protein
MPMIFTNDYVKQWLAQKGPAKVFGKDVDTRERLKPDAAVKWFDDVWRSSLERAIEAASRCDVEFVRSKVPPAFHAHIKERAEHREFKLADCFFICQIPETGKCDQLWFISSSSGDPRTLYVRFRTVPVKEEFDKLARSLGWQRPEDLGEKILLDFMETVRRRSYRESDDESENANPF